MRKNIAWLLIVALLMPLLSAPSFAQTSQNQTSPNAPAASTEEGEPEGEDPDLPRIARGKIDKREYLRMRSEYVDKRRGLPYQGADNPRARAILQMERQRGNTKKQTTGTTEATAASSTSAAPVSVGDALMAQANTSSWTSIGPAPIPGGQTEVFRTNVSGRVTAIAVHPSNADIVYAGTGAGGVYRTLDGGTTWTALMDSAQSLSVGSIAIAPSDPTTIFVGTGEGNYSCDSFVGVGVYRITNAESASPTLSGPFNLDANGADVLSKRAVSKIVVHPTDPNIIFASTMMTSTGYSCYLLNVTSTSYGLYRSTNMMSADPRFGKITVQTGNNGNREISDIVMEPGNPNTLLVNVMGFNSTSITNDGGVWRTTSALAASPTFTRTLGLGSATAKVRAEMSITKVGSTVTVWLGTQENPSSNTCLIQGHGGILRRSNDGGVTWTLVTGGNGFCGSQCSYNIAVASDPTNANKVYLGGTRPGGCNGIVKKATDGATFTATNAGLHADTHVLVIAPSNPAIVYTGSDGGIFRSNDSGANWTSLNTTGFNATQFQSLALHPSDPFFMIGGTQDNGTEWLKPDNTWNHTDDGDGGFALIDQNAADTTNVTMYHTYYNQTGSLMGFARVQNTADATPAGWPLFGCGGTANGISCNDSAVEFYAPMALGPGNPNTLYYASDRLYRSTNRGTNMTVVSQAPIVSGTAITTVGISPQNDNVRIVGLRNGKVYATTTGSSTLTDVTSASFPVKFVARTVIDPNNQNTAYVVFSQYGIASGQSVWKTTNLAGGATTWTPAGNGLPDIPANAFVVDPADSNMLYVGTDIGVYRSTDGGLNWTPFSDGLPRTPVFDMAIQNATRTLRIATHGRGIWEIGLTLTPPAPPADPSNLLASASSTSQINLTWTDNATNESGYKIERCTGSGCTNFAQIAQAGVGATAFSDTGLAASTAYTYRIRAFNAGGDSGYSNSAEATTLSPPPPPAAPSSLTATAVSSAQINLAWADNSGNEDGFRIERCTGAGCTNFAQIALVGAGQTSFQNSGLAASTTYVYRVRAFNSGGDSGYSNEASATTQAAPQPPVAPTNLTATVISSTQINLSWTDNANDESGFQIERCTNSGCTNFAQIGQTLANVTTFNNTGLARRTTYRYRVRAFNAAGSSAYSNIVTATTPNK
jgi:hypothetical protein